MAREKLSELTEHCRKEIEKNRESIEEELGETENLKKAVTEAGFPGETRKHLKALKFYRKKTKKLEKAKNSTEGLETAELEKKIEKLEKKYAEHSKKDNTHLTEAYGTAISCLENTVKILENREHEPRDLWKTGLRKYPDEKALNRTEKEIENDLLHEIREKHVHHFLTTSRYLKTVEFNRKGLSKETEEKVGSLEEMKEEIRKISQELMEKAEKLDFLLLNASAQIRKAEKLQES
ncbi:hypothetical protein AQV86_00995 [Nanohaloarchaea archaeon SG9]|nr:hypothetical protein AQV86_00995 [Nanohaloarchaea archaeon SG9]